MNPESKGPDPFPCPRGVLEQRIRESLAPMAAIPTGVDARLAPLPGIQAVVFDIYGTLLCSGVGDIGLDDTGDRDAVIRELLRSFGWSGDLDVASPSTVWRDLIAADHDRRRAAGVDYPEVDVRELWGRWSRAVGVFEHLESQEGGVAAFGLAYECAVNPVWPYGDAASTLDSLRDAGLILGIVSNAQYYTPIILETLLGRSLDSFGFLDTGRIWSFEWGCGKPATQLFERCRDVFWEHRRIEPESILYVGNDALKDIWTATQVGFRTALYAGDKRSLRWRASDERVQGAPPDRVMTRLAQLPAMLGVARGADSTAGA